MIPASRKIIVVAWRQNADTTSVLKSRAQEKIGRQQTGRHIDNHPPASCSMAVSAPPENRHWSSRNPLFLYYIGMLLFPTRKHGGGPSPDGKPLHQTRNHPLSPENGDATTLFAHKKARFLCNNSWIIVGIYRYLSNDSKCVARLLLVLSSPSLRRML